MNREIKFRGFSKELNRWLYGHFMIGLNDEYYIIHKVKIDDTTTKLEYSIVVKESVGQFTGLADKNGKEIYEGDVVFIMNYNFIGIIYLREDRWHCKNTKEQDFDNGDYYYGDDMMWGYAEIIGNYFENPELLTENK